MTAYLWGLATLPAIGLLALAGFLAFAPNGTTYGPCAGCGWEMRIRIPIVQWVWRIAHRLFKAWRVEHVRRVREELVKFGYRKSFILAFEKKHRRAMRKIQATPDR